VKIGKKDKEIEVPQAIDVIREIDGSISSFKLFSGIFSR